MKYTLRIMQTLLFTLLILLFYSCNKDEPKIIKEKVTGHVQKGPYINGTSISMSELNSSLAQTGKIFTAQISNNSGSFEIKNISLTSSYVELSASGFYFDEVKGELSIAPLNLFALSDITDISTVNVNILTHLEKLRVEYLVEHNKTFSEAKKIAQGEILAIFGFSLSGMDNSEELDISVNNEGNAILLAISIILQGNRSVGDLTELLANISNDIREDGILNSESILSSLRNSAKELVLTTIRSNLVNRYQELGISASIPGFEKYVNNFLVFTGEKPVSTTQAATNITTTSATIKGTVNANSLSTTVTFEYGTAISYGSIATATQNPVTGSSSVDVSAAITGLLPGTIYHLRVKAENVLGITYGNDLIFTTLGQVPIAVTQSATNIQFNTATINGSVNPNYLSTTVSFEWGTTTSYGSTITATQSPVTGNDSVNVSVGITGLSPNTTYYFRVKALNDLGTSYGIQVSFTTDPLTISDIDGNSYNVIRIGTQVWMTENLKVTQYSDGTPIALANTSDKWDSLTNTSKAYCWYDDNISNKDSYGALYTWAAAMKGAVGSSTNPSGVQGACPISWHLPSDSEWEELVFFLGGNSTIVGGKLKQIGTSHWRYPNTGATNESGFTALPSGTREFSRQCYGIEVNGYWWAATEGEYRYLGYDCRNFDSSYDKDTNGFTNYGLSKKHGFSIRCLMDN